MPNVIGIDHIYITVSNIERSVKFYDPLMEILGFRKKQFMLTHEEHVQYFNQYFGYVIRPAREKRMHNSYSAGLHHFCLRVETKEDVTEIAELLRKEGIVVSDPKRYPEYAPDYFAIFLQDPDGIELEITNFRQECRERFEKWELCK